MNKAMNDNFAPIHTQRLRLRCVRPDDSARMSQLMTAGVSRWVASWPYPFTAEMADERIALMLMHAGAENMMPLVITTKDDDLLIGLVSVSRHHDDARRGVFGYWLGEVYQKKGYTTEVAPVAINAAFEYLDLDVIEAAAQLENVPSFKIMEAAGMTPVGEGMVYAFSRGREEPCRFYEIARTKAQ